MNISMVDISDTLLKLLYSECSDGLPDNKENDELHRFALMPKMALTKASPRQLFDLSSEHYSLLYSPMPFY